MVCENWDALVLNDYEAVFPIPFKKKFGITYAVQPLFCQQLGLFSSSLKTLREVSKFTDAIPKHLKFAQLHFNYLNILPLLETKINYTLDLIVDYAILRNQYSGGCSRNIKKSKKVNLGLIVGLAANDYVNLYKATTNKKDPLTNEQYAIFQQLLNTCISKSLCEIVAIYSPVNHLCSASVFLHDSKRIYYLSGASDEMGKTYGANFQAVDFIIQKYSGRELILDFEGSQIPGIARFFEGFGAKSSVYPIWKRNELIWPLNKIVASRFR